MTKNLKWSGRSSSKDALRARIWQELEDLEIAVGTPWDSIPNFKGAVEAAEQLRALPIWQNASIVKSNPDAPQIPVRLNALRDGKKLYMPVPELVEHLPFVLLDPVVLQEKSVSFEEAATIEGALKHGQRVEFTGMMPMDLLVVGCVAASKEGGRTGKGAGFADLELGIFREVGTIAKGAVILTTVHDVQVVPGDELPLQAHDSPLDWVVTPTQAIETNSSHPQPKGVDWDAVQPEQYQNIPFLKELRDRYQQ